MPTSDRIHLANLPTPLERAERLSDAWARTTNDAPQIWIKRDDLTGFGLSGNKVRKLEYHLAAAIDAGAETIVTCGAAQSNHCRATAIAAASLGLRTVLFLRTADGRDPSDTGGNYLLMRLAGARFRFITPEQWEDRDQLMAEASAEMGAAWVIPEGASDPLGARGFVNAAHELAIQVEDFTGRFTIWHPAMSAGTTAGLFAGAVDVGLDADIVGCSVGHDAEVLTAHVDQILEGMALRPAVAVGSTLEITDDYVGGGYGVISNEQMEVQSEATRLTGLFFDPTYTGKALYGLHQEIAKGRYGPDDTVIYWHTGGGFATFAYDWDQFLS